MAHWFAHRNLTRVVCLFVYSKTRYRDLRYQISQRNTNFQPPFPFQGNWSCPFPSKGGAHLCAAFLGSGCPPEGTRAHLKIVWLNACLGDLHWARTENENFFVDKWASPVYNLKITFHSPYFIFSGNEKNSAGPMSQWIIEIITNIANFWLQSSSVLRPA